jgi:polysaccharide export outer membrane protein
MRNSVKSSTQFVLTACLVPVLIIGGRICAQESAANQSSTNTANGATTDPPAPSSTRPRIRSDATYVIGDADVLSINVWKEPDISKQVPVRSDGKISLPLVGEVQATGETPLQLEQAITNKLKGYMTDPEVTVIVEQINSQKYNVFGQVAKPGAYTIIAGTTIMDAIAAAGGLRDFAKKKGIYVLRQNPGGLEERFDFNYDKFIKGKSPTQNILLKPHDTIVVP